MRRRYAFSRHQTWVEKHMRDVERSRRAYDLKKRSSERENRAVRARYGFRVKRTPAHDPNGKEARCELKQGMNGRASPAGRSSGVGL